MTFCSLSVIPLLVALQIDQGVWPPYASVMLIELYKTTASSSGYSVRVVYNGKVYNLPFCSGSDLCDYKTFSTYLSTITPSDPARQCLITAGKKWRWHWTVLVLNNWPALIWYMINYFGVIYISLLTSVLVLFCVIHETISLARQLHWDQVCIIRNHKAHY